MGSATYLSGSHLKFKKLFPNIHRKTDMYEVFNKMTDEKIGAIHWRGGWRQYVFQAEPNIDMSRSCQKEIIKFMDKLMSEWRKKRTSDNLHKGKV
jgi:hypothetical protein